MGLDLELQAAGTVKRLWGRRAMKSALFFSKLASVILNEREERAARESSPRAPFIVLFVRNEKNKD